MRILPAILICGALLAPLSAQAPPVGPDDPLPPGAVARFGSPRFRHGGSITSIDFAPDGRTIATASHDQSIRIWDATTGREIRRFWIREEWAMVQFVRYTPDGGRIVAGLHDGSMRIWDVTTGEMTLRIEGQGEGFLGYYDISRDGRRLASGGNGTITLWDLKTGGLLRSIRLDSVGRIAFSPDGKHLAAAAGNPFRAGNSAVISVVLGDAETGQEVARWSAGSETVSDIRFSPDGRTLAVSGMKSSLRLWDVAAGKAVTEIEGRGQVAFSPDGSILTALSRDRQLRFWETSSGRLLAELPPPHTWSQSVFGPVAFSPDGRTLACGVGSGLDGVLRLVDVRNDAGGERLIVTWRAPDDDPLGSVDAMAVSPDGTRLVTGGQDRTLRIWDVTNRKEIRRLGPLPVWIRSLAFAPDGRRLALASSQEGLRILDVLTGGEYMRLGLDTRGVSDAAFSADGRILVGAGADGNVRVWNHDTGKEQVKHAEPGYRFRRVSLTPNGHLLAAVGDAIEGGGMILRVWEVIRSAETGDLSLKELHRPERPKISASRGLTFTPNSRFLLTCDHIGNNNSHLALWNMESGKEIRSLSCKSRNLSSVSFSSDGRSFATAEHDVTVGGVASIYETETFRLLRRIEAGPGMVLHAAFSPDGRRLFTGMSDSTVLVWDLERPPDPVPAEGGAAESAPSTAAPGAKLDGDGESLPPGAVRRIGTLRLRHHRHPSCIAFSPDGGRLASGGADSYVRLWDVVSGNELAAFRHERSVGSLAFSPDGNRLASSSQAGGIVVWDLLGRKELRRLDDGGQAFNTVRFLPDGKRILARGPDLSICVWDLQDGREIRRFKLPEKTQTFSHDLAVRSDPPRVAVPGPRGVILVFDPDEGLELPDLRTPPDRSLASLLYLPGGGPLLTADSGGKIQRRDPDFGTVLGEFSLGDRFRTMAASPDGRRLAVSDGAEKVMIADPGSGKLLRQWVVPDRVCCMAFAPDGMTLATVSGSFDHAVRLWNTGTGDELPTAPGNGSGVTLIDFSPDGKTIAFAGYQSLWLADTVGGRTMRELGGHRSPIWSAAFSPDGKALASIGYDKRIRIWDVADGTERVSLPGHGDGLSAVDFTPNGDLLISGGGDGRLCLWDRRDDGLREEHLLHRKIGSVAAAPDGKTIALGMEGGVMIWDIDRRSPAGELSLNPDSKDVVRTVSFSRDGSLLMAPAGGALVWDVATKHPRLRIRSAAHLAALAPDGRSAVHWVYPNRLCLVDSRTGETIVEWTGHEADVSSIAFSPDGRHVATGSSDTTVLVWDLELLKRRK